MTTKTQNRTVELEGYRFLEDAKTHVHQRYIHEEWKNLTGVSEVVKSIGDFGSAAYYGSRRALMGLGYDPKVDKESRESEANRQVREAGTSLMKIKGMDDHEWRLQLDRAYRAHAKYSKERAELGTDKHAEIDVWIKECIETNKGLPLPSESEVIYKFTKMVERFNPRFLASEKHGYNDDLWIGGITDVIVESDLGLGIWDMKNRENIYPKDILQMGGYAWLHPLDFTNVFGIPLEGNDIVAHYDVKGLKEAFLHQLEVYRFIKSIEK